MDYLLYIIIPFGAFILFAILKSLERYYLKKKSDTQSRIKYEARQTHYEEDHNNRFIKSNDSTFLWEVDELDEGIDQKLKRQFQNEE